MAVDSLRQCWARAAQAPTLLRQEAYTAVAGKDPPLAGALNQEIHPREKAVQDIPGSFYESMISSATTALWALSDADQLKKEIRDRDLLLLGGAGPV